VSRLIERRTAAGLGIRNTQQELTSRTRTQKYNGDDTICSFSTAAYWHLHNLGDHSD
jgi:hypothetical protein